MWALTWEMTVCFLFSAQFILCSMTLAGVSLFLSVFILTLYHHAPDTPPPKFAQKLLKTKLAHWLCVTRGHAGVKDKRRSAGSARIKPEVTKQSFERKAEVSLEQALAEAETIEDLERIAQTHAPAASRSDVMSVVRQVRGRAMTSEQQVVEREEGNGRLWRALATFLDRALLIVFSISVVINIITYFARCLS